MPGTSTFAANAFLNWLRGQTMPAAPGGLYMGLFNGDPESNGVEVTTSVRTAGRVPVTFSAPNAKKITNTADVDFGNSAGQATITHFALFDAVTNGNMYVPKQISAQRQVAQGDPVKYPASNLNIQM